MQSRMEAGDHWVLYATIDDGQLQVCHPGLVNENIETFFQLISSLTNLGKTIHERFGDGNLRNRLISYFSDPLRNDISLLL